MRLDIHMAVLLVVFAILPSVLYSMLLIPWIAYVLAKRGGLVSSHALQPLWPAFFLLFQGLVFGHFSDPAAMGKDGWYILKMALAMQAGVLIGFYTPLNSHWLRPVAWAAALISLDQVMRALAGIGGEHARHLSFVGVFMAPFILKYYPGALLVRWLLIAPALMTIALAQSRTGIVVMLVAWMGARGFYQKKTRLTLGVLGFIVVGSIGYQFLPEYDMNNITFLGKLQNSVKEMSFEDGYSRRDMYANWRGFEAYRAYNTWMDGSTLRKLLGGGFGQNIDLGTLVLLGDNYEVSEIPYAHNGYFSVLVKFGVVGLAAFVFLLARPFLMASEHQEPDAEIVAQIAAASALMLIFTTLVISGPLNRSSMDGVTLVFGFALGGMQRLRTLVPISPHERNAPGPLQSPARLHDQIVPS